MQVRPSQLHNTKTVSVRQFGYHEDKNYPTRQTMEDNYIALDDFNGQGDGLFAILDGHGGPQVSEYCASVLPNLLQQEMLKDKTNMRAAICRAMVRTDEQLKLVGASDTGSTCCLALVYKQGNRKVCIVGNLGDTRAVLASEGKAKRVSIDHKPTNPSEIDRVTKEGGVIVKGRVSGQLAVTRALGDLELKKEGVSIVPDFEEFEVTDKTIYLIIASDGLWDVCEDQKAVDLCKGIQATNLMATTLLKYAKSSGSKDNISILVIRF